MLLVQLIGFTSKYDASLIYKKEEVKFTIEVKDTKAPVFKDILKEVLVEQDAEDVDFTKYFMAEDLIDSKITVDSEKVDLAKQGDYEIKVTAKDKYKNEDTKAVKVKVISLEDAKKENGVTKTLDGTVYQSKAIKDKIAEEQKVEEEKKAQEEQANTNTGGGSFNGGSSSNGSGGGNTSAPAQPYYRTDIASTYDSQINAYHQQNGLSSLSITGEAQNWANKRAMDLISNYGHDSSAWGENIGMGDIGYNFFIGWQNSPSHNGTMLESSMYDSFAVSVVEYYGKWYAATVFHNKWS